MKHCILSVIVLCISGSFNSISLADNDFIEILRSDLKTQKTAIVSDAMQLSKEESEVFWPIYREYSHEQDKLVDKRLAVLKDYAANFQTMTNEKAKELGKESLSIQKQRLALREKYYKRISKALSPIIGVRFAQVDHQFATVIDLGVARGTPLIHSVGAPE